MKEFLAKYEDGTFAFMNGDGYSGQDNWIEIPDGAEIAFVSDDIGKQGTIAFAKGNDKEVFVFDVSDVDWDSTSWDGMKEFLEYGFNIVWQREKESLNNKVVSAEEFRKQSIIDKLVDLPELNIDKEHGHYFKDVSDVNSIDVYEVLKRFGVTDPCLQHIVKKALCAGDRGHKDFETDLKNIYDTSKRALEINGIKHGK